MIWTIKASTYVFLKEYIKALKCCDSALLYDPNYILAQELHDTLISRIGQH